jgi:hypothetical protein
MIHRGLLLFCDRRELLAGCITDVSAPSAATVRKLAQSGSHATMPVIHHGIPILLVQEVTVGEVGPREPQRLEPRPAGHLYVPQPEFDNRFKGREIRIAGEEH